MYPKVRSQEKSDQYDVATDIATQSSKPFTSSGCPTKDARCDRLYINDILTLLTCFHRYSLHIKKKPKFINVRYTLDCHKGQDSSKSSLTSMNYSLTGVSSLIEQNACCALKSFPLVSKEVIMGRRCWIKVDTIGSNKMQFNLRMYR